MAAERVLAGEVAALEGWSAGLAELQGRVAHRFRLLLAPEPVAPAPQVREGHGDEHDRGGLRAGLDGSAGRAADD